MRENNLIAEKSMAFAVRIVKLYGYLVNERKATIMSKQLMRSGTSIGANVREAIYTQSRKDFVSKLSISLKEASETGYWLELLSKTGYLSEQQYNSMSEDCVELMKMLTVIIKSSKTEV